MVVSSIFAWTESHFVRAQTCLLTGPRVVVGGEPVMVIHFASAVLPSANFPASLLHVNLILISVTIELSVTKRIRQFN